MFSSYSAAAAGLAIVAMSTASVSPADAAGVESSFESQLQIDFQVSDAALRKFLPAGWELTVEKQGPAKDCNLRLIFVDRTNITGADNKPATPGAEQIVYLAVPMKRTGSDVGGQVIIAGFTSEAASAPGKLGNFVHAPATMNRSTSLSGGAIREDARWAFAAKSGEKLEIHAKYTRVPSMRINREVKYFSATDPAKQLTSKIDQGFNIARNATIQVPDNVQEFSYKVSGGRLGTLFDGTEKVLSIDIFPWFNQTVTAP